MNRSRKLIFSFKISQKEPLKKKKKKTYKACSTGGERTVDCSKYFSLAANDDQFDFGKTRKV